MSPRLIQPLQRGGVLVPIHNGPSIQFGIPPETVKDSMAVGLFPDLYVSDPDTMIDSGTGRTSEPEFPMYFGFFARNQLSKPTVFATPKPSVKHLDKILRTSYLGPQWSNFSSADLAKEYPEGIHTVGFPDMKAELDSWHGFGLDQMRRILSIGPDGLLFEGARITYFGDSLYGLEYENSDLGIIDVKRYAFPPLNSGDNKHLYDPRFQNIRYQLLYKGKPMVVPIHGSSGFDGNGGTASHMIWNNGKVILVDPPADILEFLIANHIPLEAIDGVILTHVHGDHDSGTLQVLASGNRVKLYTTRSIQRMYLDKLHAMTNGRMSKNSLKKLYSFSPLKMLESTEVNGLKMRFFHGYHANIAFGYEIRTPNGSAPVFSFSGDTFNDPSIYGKIRSKNNPNGPIASLARADDIVRLPLAAAWAGGIALHEKGAPPIHTTGDRLQSEIAMLTREGLSGQILGYHASDREILESGIQPLGDGNGLLNAVALNLPATPLTRSVQAERILRSLPIFHGVDSSMIEELIRLGTIKPLNEGETLIQEGSSDTSEIYLLLDGELDITREDGRHTQRIATITQGLIGEGALFDETRNASVRAGKPLTSVFSWKTSEIEAVLEAHGILDRLRHLRDMRNYAYEALRASPDLSSLYEQVIDGLLLIAQPVVVPAGESIIQRGDRGRDMYLVVDGNVHVTNDINDDGIDDVIASLNSGDMFGEVALINDVPRSASIKSGSKPVTLLRFPADGMTQIVDDYPTLRLRLNLLAQSRQQ